MADAPQIPILEVDMRSGPGGVVEIVHADRVLVRLVPPALGELGGPMASDVQRHLFGWQLALQNSASRL